MVYDATGMDSNVSQGIRQQVPQQSESKNLPYEGGSDDDQTDKKNVDVGDIELEEVQHQPDRQYNINPNDLNVGAYQDQKQIDESDEFSNYSFDPNHFIVTAVKSYQRTSIWWCMAIALCSMRAANRTTVAFAYISLICRVIQLGSIYTQNKNIAYCAYIFATFFLCLMFMAEMVKEEADIIHESVPTPEQMEEYSEDLMHTNYRPPTDREGRHSLLI